MSDFGTGWIVGLISGVILSAAVVFVLGWWLARFPGDSDN